MSETPWWQDGVIYQVYPRSFQDSDGDGIGDLKGIAARLEHLAGLHVAAVWISPVFPSPMVDFGYDIADYRGIDPIFGTMADFDALLGKAHRLGLRVILDFVPNHTSDRHPWFQDSRSGRDAPRRDWYIWRDPAPDGGPPNNWMSNFGGSAWEWDAATGQYYYHAFLKQQPDLNWRNKAVRAAMYDVLRFWFDKGVDGFRIDVLWHLIKDDRFRDNPPNPSWHEGLPDQARVVQLYSCDQPEIQNVLLELRTVADAYPGRVLIGEIYLPVERLVAYYGPELKGIHLPFNFQLLSADWNAAAIARIVRSYEAVLPRGGWPNWVLGNHDKSRIATRIGAGPARAAAMLLLTLRGTPTLYYGDELGMEDVAIPSDRVRDPAEKNQPGKGQGRDPERTPMPWDPSPKAGFTRGEPWLPLGPDHGVRNVAAADQDGRSMLALYRRLLRLRRDRRALRLGAIEDVAADGDLLRYRRTAPGENVLALLNLGGAELAVEPPPGATRLLLSTHLDRGSALPSPLALRPGEGVLVELRAAG